jgi:hypothetical protein
MVGVMMIKIANWTGAKMDSQPAETIMAPGLSGVDIDRILLSGASHIRKGENVSCCRGGRWV